MCIRDRLVVVQVLLDDDVYPAQSQGAVGAGANLQVVLRLRAKPREPGIDVDELHALLHQIDDPMADESVGIGDDGIVAPDDADFGHLVARVVVCLLYTSRCV